MSASPVTAKQSASVVIARDGTDALEVLLLQRNRKIDFHGGEWVFPGGRVDAEDTHGAAEDEITVARRTAAREAHEEAGVDVSAHKLLPFAHWTTPVDLPKRFTTWFFATTLARDVPIQVDGSEIVDSRWLTPAAALAMHLDGELSLPGPTFVTLRGFEHLASAAALTAHLRGVEVQHFTPRLVKFDGGRCAVYREDVSFESGNLDTPGARHRLLMQGQQFDYLCDY